MFKLPTSHSAFQYSCDIIQPEPEIEYMEDEADAAVMIKPKKNNRLPGERLLKQLYKQEKKEREKKILFDDRIQNSIMTVMNDLSIA